MAGRMAETLAFSKRPTVAMAVVAMALSTVGCVFNNKLQPLSGEDPKALAISGERQVWLEKTGATRALEDLRKAIKSRNGNAIIQLLGPQTRSVINQQAKHANVDPQDLLVSGKTVGLGFPGVPDPLTVLATDGPVSCREADPFDPARRAVRLRIKADGRDEFLLPAVFSDSGWQLELVGSDAALPQANPGPVPGDPS